MARVWFLLALVVIVLTVYTLVECALIDRNRIRALPRWAWLIVIIVVPVIGPAMWVLLGRGGRRDSGARPARSSAPDDDPEFLRRLEREKTQQERIRKLERELADLDEPGPTDGTGTAGTTGAPPKKTEPGDGDVPDRRDA
ncbi:PLDc N-terminal domain-containing protein [Cryobacterium tepidiphilum]|jgi:hypothetical protein|uniref:Cardiolipin synthase N-terminal domain-containing protein n=1 Tax=Cryobacterium tepidiphilum TaxID=2486026 RepID=A0A3M8LBM5_9MICO|nr:PLDc N-terminal domain-containing protein [Cryobacterium tepidiphilum]RNE62104.1 hypothetical protein EEJ31_09280 [Cryobacterium tepidiphilum]